MSDQDVTRTPMQLCPHCGYSVDAHGTTDGAHAAPGPGDFCVCMACALISRYSATMQMIPTTIDDPDMHPEDREEILKAIKGIEFLRERNPAWPSRRRSTPQ